MRCRSATNQACCLKTGSELKEGFCPCLVEERGGPPVTVRATGQRFNQLNYVPNRGINNLA